jgi:hypothetical protein
MDRPNTWLMVRVAFLLLGIFVIGQAIHIKTNFDPLAGLICGAVGFLFVIFVVIKKSTKNEQIFQLTAPCWPAAKYPQGYWFTWGAIFLISALVNLMLSLDNPDAVKLYVGMVLLGLGILAGAIVGHYRKRSAL